MVPANFDKPNDLVQHLISSSRGGSAFQLIIPTARKAITYPVATYYMGDILLVHYSDRNKYRIPDYMRLDLHSSSAET